MGKLKTIGSTDSFCMLKRMLDHLRSPEKWNLQISLAFSVCTGRSMRIRNFNRQYFSQMVSKETGCSDPRADLFAHQPM